MPGRSISRKLWLVGTAVGTALLLGGCGGNPQQLLQAVAGLLGGLSGQQAGGPLGGPVTGSLPSAPLGPAAPATPGGGVAAPSTTPPGGSLAAAGDELGQRIKQAAYELPDPFPYKPGTENGNLGCADVITTALENAGATSPSEHQLSVVGTEDLLEKKGWQSLQPPPYKDGDVIIWGPTATISRKHIGIIVIENGEVYAINNSSSQKRPVKVLLSSYNRPIERIMRNPGSGSA